MTKKSAMFSKALFCKNVFFSDQNPVAVKVLGPKKH